ncbi:ADP-ribosylglycohydrolase family protein [Halosimplex pelagicum]|uniref:ADP-ribosylglycohydrolase family protein n=1 Tax=Halosimplex pelagicum TaxID=869886 RepID=A0A7D5TDD4_9EURY|nr:ADP-ribosylglycohydrolase family protein [Halosimplex pelagicum]QLH83833.1 ADP-ribosylglycohydrolase family protein [Halosimplex pelagicum]
MNRGGDSGTTEAIAGAVAGARFGASRIPDQWLGAIDEGDEMKDSKPGLPTCRAS